MNSGKTDIWMPVYIGDYLADTMHLSTEQHGAYLLLLFHLWRRGTLPDDDTRLAHITGLNTDAWSNARALLAEFFEISDGCWHHRRIERERERIALTQERNSRNAKNAAKGRWARSNALTSGRSIDPEDAPSIASDDAGALRHACKSDPQSKSETEKERSTDLVLVEPSLFSRSPDSIFGNKTPDPRHARFRTLLGEYWAYKNPTSPQMPWQGRDAKALSEFLSACPALSENQFRELLRNRARSAVAHGDRVYLWIANLTRFQE